MAKYNLDKISVMDSYCALNTFFINGVEVDGCDFVDKYDHAADDVGDDGGCGDMRADTIVESEEVLNKYKISEDEYDRIADKIADVLSFGRCLLCT